MLDSGSFYTDQSDDVSLPSAIIDRAKLSHEVLQVLHEFSYSFSETPGFCPYVKHSTIIDTDLKPKRLGEHRTPKVI